MVDVKSVVSTLAALRAAVICDGQAGSPAPDWPPSRSTIVILVAILLLVPRPGAMQLRDWATSVGPWFPLAFLAAHIVVTVFPFPRTAFTLAVRPVCSARWLGIAIAVVASTVSALLALLLVRAAGWRLDRLVPHPRVEALDARLRQRGWPTVMSMRLIPAVPFSVLNYAAGASAVRVLPYTSATLAGLLPGTAAVVDPRRRAHRPHQPAADPGVAVHRESRCRGPGLRDPHLPAPPPGETAGAANRCGDPATAADHPAAAVTAADTA